jgi:hypothetical protein
VYQKKRGTRLEIAARYVINAHHIRFDLARYDASRPLYIDPLIYSTFLGGSALEYGNSIAIDSAGNAYVTGGTESSNFPVSSGAFQTTGLGVFVSKLNSTGSALLYSTYLGGGVLDEGYSIAVDSAGNAYVTGSTESSSFPVTRGAFQTSGVGVFVTKLNSTGSALVYSTYLGADPNNQGAGIAVDSAGSAFVVGVTYSSAFPTTSGSFQTTFGGVGDAFVTRLNPAGSALVYSTFLGGSNADYGKGVAVDGEDNAYVTGVTNSTNLPVTPNAFQTTCRLDSQDMCDSGFVAKFNSNGSAVAYLTYLGGNGDGGDFGIALDDRGDAYLTGTTNAANFPVTPGAFQTTYGGGDSDAFVSELNPEGTDLVYSTFLGGSNQDGGSAIALDSASDVYVTGGTESSDFPVTFGAFQTTCNHGSYCSTNGDAFVVRINSTGSTLIYSTYLGGRKADYGLGIAVDSSSDAYVIGSTFSSGFPITPGAFQTVCNDGKKCGKLDDAFVTKIQTLPATTTTLSSAPNPSTKGQAVTFTASVSSGVGPPPDGEIVSFMKAKTILGTGSLSGGTATFTTSTLKVGTTKVNAVYSGDQNFLGSSSNVVQQIVDAAK